MTVIPGRMVWAARHCSTKPGEHLVAIDFTQIDKVPSARDVCLSIATQVIGLLAKLCGDELGDFERDDLARRQQPSRIPKGAKLQGKAQTIVRLSPTTNLLKVFGSERVLMQEGRVICRQVKQGRTLAIGKNLASGH